MNKVSTVDLKGKEYALVPERLRAFRQNNPRASVVTKPEFQPDNAIVFTARIVADQSKEDSAEATGHSYGKNTGDKAFEKLETVAVGRALALLGYLNNGQIATTEEMAEFEQYRADKQAEAVTLAIESLMDAKNLDELKDTFMALGRVKTDKAVIAAKDKRKAELNESN